MGKARLMIVEDDVDIANMLRIYFGSQGYDVDVAHRGSDALEKTRHGMPHLIVLDIMLPDIDGYEVCITYHHPHQPHSGDLSDAERRAQ
jgi:DNA-binding response OmpR family regulator